MTSLVFCRWKSDGFVRPPRELNIAVATLRNILGLSEPTIQRMLKDGEKVETPYAIWWMY